MHPVSFASVRPVYPMFGNRQPDSKRETDALCASIAEGNANIQDVVATTLENAAQKNDTATIRRIEGAIMDRVTDIELLSRSIAEMEAKTADILYGIQQGLKQSRAYNLSTTPDPMRASFSDWYDSKTSEYATAFEALQSPEEWALGRIQSTYR